MSLNSSEPLPSARIHQITDEFSQAIKWNSACLLLVVYRSEFTRGQVALSIRQFAEENGQLVEEFRITKAEYDVLLALKERPSQAGILHYISGLQWGGGRQGANAFHALNMHREHLVESTMRCIFWITPTELKKMTRFAPDFWAFRHKVVDFTELPSSSLVNAKGTREVNRAVEIDRLLGLLKKNPNDLASHIELAELFESLGCYEEAILHYKKTIRLAEDKSDLLLSLAKVYALFGAEHMARRIQRQAGKLIRDNPPVPRL